MDKFVARENIRHFRDRLETETDATVLAFLRRLLVQEEDKLGHNSEALREIEDHIARAKEHVNRQQVNDPDGTISSRILIVSNISGQTDSRNILDDRSSSSPSLNNLVGLPKHVGWNDYAKSPSGLKVDYEFVFRAVPGTATAGRLIKQTSGTRGAALT